MANYIVEPESGRHKLSMAFWNHVKKRMKNASFRVTDNPWGTGWITNRLGGFLESNFKSMNLFVELNAQADSPARKLTLNEVQSMGRHMLESTVTFLYSQRANPLFKSIQKLRDKRRKLVRRYEPFMQEFQGASNPFEREDWMGILPEYEKDYWEWKQLDNPNWEPASKRWFDKLYRNYDVKPGKIPDVR